jgi:hypothetical protein
VPTGTSEAIQVQSRSGPGQLVKIQDSYKGKKTFKKHLAIPSGGSWRVKLQFSFRNLRGRSQNLARVYDSSQKCLVEYCRCEEGGSSSAGDSMICCWLLADDAWRWGY